MQDVRFDLSAFGLGEMARCGAGLREAVRGAPSPETAAQTVADFFHDSMVDARSEHACSAVGVFLVRSAGLPAATAAGRPPAGRARGLSLAGFRGTYAPWRAVTRTGPSTLPVPSAQAARDVPLVYQFLERLGACTSANTDGPALPAVDAEVVYVPGGWTDGLEEELLADLVEHSVRSMLLFGGTLWPGEWFAVALLSHLSLPVEATDLFRAVAGSTGLALRSVTRPIAERSPAGRPPHGADAALDLLKTMESVVAQCAARLQSTVAELLCATEELREEAAIVELLQEAGRTLAAELDLDALVQHAVDAATRLSGAAFGAFFYNVLGQTGESYLLYVISGADRSAFDGFPMPRNTQVFEPTFRGLGVVRSHDVTADPRYGHNAPHHGMPKGHLPVRSYLAVPVTSRGTVLGGFFFGHPEPGVFTERHERLVTRVAAQTAVALQNAQAYRRERQAAMELQRHLLPTLPPVAGIVSASRYLPAARDRDVGGDWVDLIPLPEGEVALIVGDVMGKGVRAAAVMGQIRTACRAYTQLGLAPSQVLQQLSVLVDDIAPGCITTCVYAVLDTRRDRLRSAVAGHLPPVLRDPRGRVSFLDAQVGPPLGVGPRRYPQQEAALPPGARLLLYTDGLVERRGRPIDDGLRQLRELLSGPMGEIEADCDLLLDTLAGGQHDDDIALLYLQRPEDTAQRITTVVRDYAPVSGAVPDARLVVSQALREWGLTRLVNDMMLIADEMVANAVRHAKTPLRVELRRAGERIVLEVTDSSPEEPRLIISPPGEFGHRGIFLVDAIATRWGTRWIDGGKVVWAEIKTS
ncbi:hypothetical protein GCM10010358_72020 [Streptomyces minutiscleroticus]|uniref:protein-serine/threonine phosphatase n=1 Tax=Streptomyces minutiscleroticus TaxID=68238 RepID=A0A918P041_9ACTN|nr:SpoIIE family protein phosphatase [Streptomyces minutiscleroticus]GGY08628.1 hypothetical protein GCM10010358_72020 [Streptomyces minutiscleroticus]